MRCRSNKILLSGGSSGFTLTEVMASVVVLGFICAGVLAAINRAAESATNSELRTQAFEVAREHMEEVLSERVVRLETDFGTSEKYPGVEWTVSIEEFMEPAKGQSWLKVVSTAEYLGPDGDREDVELEHWLVKLSEEDAEKVKAVEEFDDESSVDQRGPGDISDIEIPADLKRLLDEAGISE